MWALSSSFIRHGQREGRESGPPPPPSSHCVYVCTETPTQTCWANTGRRSRGIEKKSFPGRSNGRHWFSPLHSKQTSLKRGKGGKKEFLGRDSKSLAPFLFVSGIHTNFFSLSFLGGEKEREWGTFAPLLFILRAPLFVLWVQNLPLLKDVYNKKITIKTIRMPFIKSQQNKDHFSLFGERVSSLLLLLLLLFFPTLTQVSPTTACCWIEYVLRRGESGIIARQKKGEGSGELLGILHPVCARRERGLSSFLS